MLINLNPSKKSSMASDMEGSSSDKADIVKQGYVYKTKNPELLRLYFQNCHALTACVH